MHPFRTARATTVALVCALAVGCGGTSPGAVDEPYEYPTLSPEIMSAGPMEALPYLQVPDDTLTRMSTGALVETVLDFPYAVNVLAYSTTQEGVDHLREQCNALDELMKRDDAEAEIRAVYDETQARGWPAGTEFSSVLTMLLEALLETL